MALRVRLGRVDRWVKVVTDRHLTPEARSESVADYARKRLTQALDQNRKALGSDTPYDQYVDGRKGAALNSVDPDHGHIIFEFELIQDAIRWVYRTLIERSPHGPSGGAGTYREAHQFFADGQSVDPEGTIPPAKEYFFANPLPYSRRLEIGKTKSGRDFLISVPNRIYERTARTARTRYGNSVQISFGYRAISDGKLHQISRIGPLRVKRDAKGRFMKGSHVRAGNQAERNLRAPAIILTPF